MPLPPIAPSLPDIPEKTVIAVFDDGVQLTMGELKQIFAVLPPENQQVAMAQRKTFVEQWALMRKLARMAETDKLDQQSPFKEELLYSRLMVLSQAKLSRAVNDTDLSADEVAKYYDANKDRYKEVRVKALYIALAPGEGKTPLTEEQAKQKAQALLAQARGGADFVKLVKANSDDVTSREKDGDFATLRPKDNIPDAIREAVFKLKAGELTEPVRQPNGYYLLRADEINYRPLKDVQQEIFSELQQQRYAQWLKQLNDSTKVQFPEPAFLGQNAAPPSPAK